MEQSKLLSEALAAAEDASRAKSAFLSNMSHEIRTPITGILGMNEMIRRESKNEDVLQYSDNIQKAGASLLGIISDILDFSKIEAGKLELFPVEYDVRELLTDSLNLVRLRAGEKGLTLVSEIDPATPARLRGDELRVKQVLTNLLTNAIKYTEKGTVKLTWRLERGDADDALIHVSVKDTGIGIRPEERDKLFSAFDRLDARRTRTIEGTGLGLAITHKMLSLMGSELKVESVYGEGSEFFFLLRQGVVDAYAGSIESKASEIETCLNEMDLVKKLFAAERNDAGLPLLPKSEFDEALSTIHDLCAAYDDTSIQMVMDMLAGYAVQEPCRRRYRELKEAFERIDWEKMSELTTPDV